MNNNSLLEKAAQQTLCEVLGFDEGRAYYLILTKNEKAVKDEFSHSKRYRLLKELFNLEAIGKLKTDDQEFFSYIILPPTFLYEKKADKELIKFLEDLYLKNFGDFLNKNFMQLVLKSDRGLVSFMLKYLMKENARIMGTKIKASLLGKNSIKVNIKTSKSSRRTIGIIDNNLVFEFSMIKDRDSYRYVGCIACQEGNKDYVSSIEREFGENL